MKRNRLLPFFFLFCLSIEILGCQTNKRGETEKLHFVVFYYKWLRFSPQKAEAARFLIENMKYHTSSGLVVSVPGEVEEWRAASDALYSSVIDGHSLTDFPKDSLEKMQKEHLYEHLWTIRI